MPKQAKELLFASAAAVVTIAAVAAIVFSVSEPSRFQNDPASVRTTVAADVPIGRSLQFVRAYARRNYTSTSWDGDYRCLGALFVPEAAQGRYATQRSIGSAATYFYFDDRFRLTRIRYDGGYGIVDLKTSERVTEDINDAVSDLLKNPNEAMKKLTNASR